jgi:hypothetical protein
VTENEIKLKAVAALTGLRGGVQPDYVSDLLGEVVPTHFVVPVEADPQSIGLAVLNQLSQPLSALLSGFILAFETVAEAYDRTGPEVATETLLQELALALAREDSP